MTGGFGFGVPNRDEVRLDELQLERKLGSGTQGEVWSLADHPDLVAKLYTNEVPDAMALNDLLAFPGRLPARERTFLLDRCGWPLHRVLDGPSIKGFLMRRAPDAFRANSGQDLLPQLRELQYLLRAPKQVQWGEIQPLDVAGRLEIACDFAELVRLLHSHNASIGDISMRNTLWGEARPHRVFQLDCDSVILANGRPVVRSLDTPDWPTPGRPSALIADRYRLALFVGRVLTAKAHKRPLDPTVEAEDGEPRSFLGFMPGLDSRIAAAVQHRFDQAGGDEDEWPDAIAWLRALSGRGLTSVPAPPPPPSAPSLPPLPATLPARDTFPLQPLLRH